MSKPWRITRGDQQFTVKDVAELKLMAIGGKVAASDLVQAPESSEWLYATEVPQLKGLVKAKASDDDIDFKPNRAGARKAIRSVLLLVNIGIVVGGCFALYTLYTTKPEAEGTQIFGDHEGALGPLEALATEYATLLSEPDSKAAKAGEVPKDSRLQLIRKLGDFYEIKLPTGETGWIGTGQLVPGYLFDQDLADTYDPLFNPDEYLKLSNYAWTPRGDPKLPETLTDMMFEIVNPTAYGMTGVILKLTFLDGADNVIEVKNFEVPRLVPPDDSLFLEGIEVELVWDEETRAQVDIYGARALLPAEYSKLKAEEETRLLAEAEAKDNEG